MKFVLAFVLLIGISCQIGLGDCAPDTLYGDLKEMMQSVKNTYNEYMPNMPDIIPDFPSVSMPDSVKNGYETVKHGLGSMAKGAGEITQETMNGISQKL